MHPAWHARAERPASLSPARIRVRALADTVTQAFEMISVGRGCGGTGCAGQQQAAQALTILILADQLAHVLAAGAVAAFADLLVDEGLQAVGQPGFDTSPRFSPLFGKCLQRWRGFQGHDRKSAVVARL